MHLIDISRYCLRAPLVQVIFLLVGELAYCNAAVLVCDFCVVIRWGRGRGGIHIQRKLQYNYVSDGFTVHSDQEDTTCTLVEVLLYVHRNRRFIRDGRPGRAPRLSHNS